MNLFFIQAFIYGISGAIHCLGMCGPIALLLPLNPDNSASRVQGMLLYSLGRIVSYSSIGFIVGLVGSFFNLIGFQDILSLICGVLLILMAFSFTKVVFPIRIPLILKFNASIKTVFSLALRNIKNKKIKLFVIGIVNGFLPCGFLYMAVLSSLALGDLFNNFIYMVFFGLGTAPIFILIGLMFSVSLAPSYKKILNYFLPIITIIVGVILILRGLNLGIPMISPQLNGTPHASIKCH